VFYFRRISFLIILLLSDYALCYQSEETAIKTVLEITYKETGIEDNINNYIQSLIKDEYKKYLETILPIADTIHKQKIEISWEF